MSCTDPRAVSCLEEAFDLTTTEVVRWELELIRAAVVLKVIILSTHAERAAAAESIPELAIWRVIRDGRARSKDLTTKGGRKLGINFEAKVRGGRWVRVKVSWLVRYVVVTVHTL
jgi:hypothetical protein